MPTPDETKILKIIEAEGSECSIGRIAAKMRIDRNYVRVILRSMGEHDMIDLLRSGMASIAGKGATALGKKPEQSDGMKRYLEDRAKWKTF